MNQIMCAMDLLNDKSVSIVVWSRMAGSEGKQRTDNVSQLYKVEEGKNIGRKNPSC